VTHFLALSVQAEMLGQNISILVDEAYADKHDSFIQRYIRGGGKFNLPPHPMLSESNLTLNPLTSAASVEPSAESDSHAQGRTPDHDQVRTNDTHGVRTHARTRHTQTPHTPLI
jgi:hypothetical protein